MYILAIPPPGGFLSKLKNREEFEGELLEKREKGEKKKKEREKRMKEKEDGERHKNGGIILSVFYFRVFEYVP